MFVVRIRSVRCSASAFGVMVLLSGVPSFAQSTAGFPPENPRVPPRSGAPTPPPSSPAPAPAPSPYPSPAPPPSYPAPPPSYPAPPPSYPAPAPPPSYPAPPPSYPAPAPYPSPYPPPSSAAPPDYGPAYPPPPPPPPNPLLDQQLRYRQALGAYQRPVGAPGAEGDAGSERGGYVRVGERTRRRHDGFYFRFGGGVGSGHDAMESDRPLPTQRELAFAPTRLVGSGNATAPVTELAIGFTPARGLVAGIGSYTATLSSLEVDTAATPSVGLRANDTGGYVFRVSQLAVFGPFLDWYIDEDAGFHVQGSPGVATFVAGAGEPKELGAQAQAHTAVGFGFMLGVGYEWWIADQWSLGLLGRLVYGTTSGSDNRGVGWTHASYAPAVLLGVTYH